ncbi:ATP-binding protein [Streptomyces sp. NPDC058686]|uniref:ATP-binding protein n=1 Tax=Streptomyces sp. NPDC058686 TaxID=3346599 RepID=UPI0036677BD9
MNLDRRTKRTTSRGSAQLALPHLLLLYSCPESAADARHFVRDYLGAVAPDAADGHLDDVVLIVSELVTNAVQHGTAPGDPLRLVVDADDRRTRVEVHDPARHHPCIRDAASQDDDGRGLAIVNALCLGSWGVTDTTTGKAVWAEVAAS